MSRTWLITGCSTGFGKLLAEAALSRGDNVVATARDPGQLRHFEDRYAENVRTIALDVSKAGAAAAAVELAASAFGGLDILVNNAGHGLIGAIEEGTPDEYRPMFETDVFGLIETTLIETTRAALPALRQRGGGRIVNLSSVAGLVGRGGHGFYASTKFAVERLSEALAQEVAPFGIAVIIVEPGPFRTDFLGRSIATARKDISAYADTGGKARAYRDSNDGKQAGDPAKAVAVILKAIDAEAPPLHLLLGEAAYNAARGKFAASRLPAPRWRSPASLRYLGVGS